VSGKPPQKTKHLRTLSGWIPDGSGTRGFIASVKLERAEVSRRTAVKIEATDLRKPL